MSVFILQFMHGLLVFGGVDKDTGLELESAFDLGFCQENCLASWEKVGAAPLTRKCLNDPQVRKSLDEDKDYTLLVNSVQEANEYACYVLTEGGYNGSVLQALVIIKPTEIEPRKFTECNSKERIVLLARANTHGNKFFVTGGSHVCSDEFV